MTAVELQALWSLVMLNVYKGIRSKAVLHILFTTIVVDSYLYCIHKHNLQK